MSRDKIKVAFLDRDGVINKEVNYLYEIDKFQYTKNCITGLVRLKELGFEIIVITNQAGIARGYYSESDYRKLTNWYVSDLAGRGINVLDVYHCPHHPKGKVDNYRKDCLCRKPNPGMIEQALDKYDIDLSLSILVGDKMSDIGAGINAGVGQLFLMTEEEKRILPEENYINVSTLLDASNVLSED